jgi:peptidoglycan/LPS O-acetylase OafA/YrhL
MLVFERAVPYVQRQLHGVTIPRIVLTDGGTVAVLALSILVAHLSFKYFERPFLRMKERFTFVASREEVTEASGVAR